MIFTCKYTRLHLFHVHSSRRTALRTVYRYFSLPTTIPVDLRTRLRPRH